MRTPNLSILTQFIHKKQNPNEDSDVGENPDGLPEVDLIHFFSPSLCITVHINC